MKDEYLYEEMVQAAEGIRRYTDKIVVFAKAQYEKFNVQRPQELQKHGEEEIKSEKPKKSENKKKELKVVDSTNVDSTELL